MDEKKSQDSAINLTTNKYLNEMLPNGDICKNGENGESTQVPGKAATTVSGASKRKSKSCDNPQVPLVIPGQQAVLPQQMQQLLQQQQLGTPQQLQHVLQQQSMMLQHQQQQKLHEQVLHQLNEQLQLNVLQQSQLMQQQQDKSKNNKQLQQQLQQLALQQQQLIQQIQQIQLQQRQYLLACLMQNPFGMPQAGLLNHGDMQQLWKDMSLQAGGSSIDETILKNVLNGVTGATVSTSSINVSGAQTPSIQSTPFAMNGVSSDGVTFSGGHSPSKQDEKPSPSTPLYKHGVCKWPGCDTHCEDHSSFLKHINSEHQLDDRSTAQARVQMQVVSQLENQVSREKELLDAMMEHLHMNNSGKPQSPSHNSHDSSQRTQSHSQHNSIPSPQRDVKPEELSPTTPLIPKHLMSQTPTNLSMSLVTAPQVIVPTPPQSQPPTPTIPPPSTSQPQTPSSSGPIRRRVSDRCNFPSPGGIEEEIQRNREFYKTTDVRPPFTYASLIRQGIIESPNRQLTLNEIYQWFQRTFAYFRRNEATWKNAVRHNLSLHKCFMRVENVKGAVWTVDEIEFYKRRPQKMNERLSTDSDGNFGLIKGSPLSQDPSIFGDNLNASLQAALAESNQLHLFSQAHGLIEETAEDLSMRSHMNGDMDSSSNMDRIPQELTKIKQEPEEQEGLPADELNQTQVDMEPDKECYSQLSETELNNSETVEMVVEQTEEEASACPESIEDAEKISEEQYQPSQSVFPTTGNESYLNGSQLEESIPLSFTSAADV